MPRPTPRFHIRRTRSGQYRPYLRAANGEQVGGSETYVTLAGAVRWTRSLARWATKALEQPAEYEGRK